mmetsp:Transcript_25397/g.59096  ORF Transcript_25397/g.59096 Transcript_25397/m.59096 type:complete len:84 (+) Transcript_25397:149-400(+)|eukprot:CAMPEP_0178431644 /NCGR_PEP_ID=MMETSP0689_2-20121128/31962_1 /TAXON_ID=160604 /ORGANISM="Amphidinium massartii, Strain CS-259" /LENGTH=83 /DNA_ID=CAMNT_0020053579 /DNA_START=74 /DNA_END=325 /DNA_ORIENTATION=-
MASPVGMRHEASRVAPADGEPAVLNAERERGGALGGNGDVEKQTPGELRLLSIGFLAKVSSISLWGSSRPGGGRTTGLCVSEG